MPMLARWTTIALTGVSWIASAIPGQARAQTIEPRHVLSAGPAYISRDGHDRPQFPAIDMVVHLADRNGVVQPVRPADLKLHSGNTELGSGRSARTFADTGYGIKAILVLDASGSMKGAPLDTIRSSIAKFVNRARSQDMAQVVTIADDTRIEVPFGAGQQALAEHLQKITSRGSLTRLYDGLWNTLSQFGSAPPERRQLVVISDGHDEGSQHTIDDVIRQARAGKVPVDCIGLTRSHPEYLQTLARISQQTGGSYAQAQSPQQLDTLIGNGIDATRATPVVAFDVSKLNSDGKTHNLVLSWEPEHLTASVDVLVPQMTPSTRKSIYKKPVVWVLGCCFVLGSIFLIMARRYSRRAVLDAPAHPEPVTTPEPVPVPPSIYRSGDIVRESNEEFAQGVQKRIAEAEAVPARPRERAQTRMVFFVEPAQGQSICLEAIAGPLTGRSFPVKGNFSIGAVEGNQLIVPDDPTLSGFHARILLANSILMIEDLGSTNGTFVNGVRLGHERGLLKPDDEIRVGRSIFRLLANKQAALRLSKAQAHN